MFKFSPICKLSNIELNQMNMAIDNKLCKAQTNKPEGNQFKG